MPVLPLRPNESIQNGKWTIFGPTGTTLHQALQDDDDATYIQCTELAELETEIFKVGLSDVSLPAGSKIFSVGVRARVQQVDTNPGGGGSGPDPRPRPRCRVWWIQRVIYSVITRDIARLFRLVFSFECPPPKPPAIPNEPTPPVEWETIEQAKYLQQPAGGEWTAQSFNDFVFGMGRDNAQDPARISAVYVDVEYNTPPVVTVLGPTGTSADTTTPEVSWLYSDQESDRQQSWQVRVFEPEVYQAGDFDPATSLAFADSGERIGEDLAWVIDRDLPNGVWRAYVRVQQVWLGIGAHRSTWSFTEWTQSVPGPPAPSINAVYEPALNRVRVELAEGGPVPETISYNIYASNNAGLSWELVRDGYQIGVGADRSATIYDYEARPKLLRTYRAQAFRQLGGIRASSGFSNEASTFVRIDEPWIKDVLTPARNMLFPLAASGDQYKTPRDQGIFKPVVAEGVEARAIPVTGPVYGREGTFTLIITERDPEDLHERVAEMWRAGGTLLYQLPHGEQFYIRLGKELAVSEWLTQGDQVRYRRYSVDYVEVKKPPIEMPFFVITA